MTTANLKNPETAVISGNDNVVIVDNFQSIRGGRTLDVTGYSPTLLSAGHLIIRETAKDEYKPMPVNAGNTAYEALPANHEYAGVLIASIPTAKPFAGILVRGTVNPAAAPYPMDTILADVKTALPLIDFRQD
jgi:hypothetical protein